MTILRVRKKPVEVEAMRLDGTKECALSAITWSGKQDSWLKEYHLSSDPSENPQWGITIKTIDGNLAEVQPWDYLMKGVANEFYPCQSRIFEASHEVLP